MEKLNKGSKFCHGINRKLELEVCLREGGGGGVAHHRTQFNPSTNKTMTSFSEEIEPSPSLPGNDDGLIWNHIDD